MELLFNMYHWCYMLVIVSKAWRMFLFERRSCRHWTVHSLIHIIDLKKLARIVISKAKGASTLVRHIHWHWGEWRKGLVCVHASQKETARLLRGYMDAKVALCVPRAKEEAPTSVSERSRAGWVRRALSVVPAVVVYACPRSPATLKTCIVICVRALHATGSDLIV